MAEADQPGLEQRIRRIEDRMDIRQVLERYCDAITRRDWDGVADCYLEEASFHELPPVELWMPDREEIVRRTRTIMGAFKSTVMMVHSCVIDLDGDTARVGTILHETGRTNGGNDFTMFGRYDDEIVRRGRRWYIAKRVFQPVQWTFPPDFEDDAGVAPVEASSPY